MTRLSKIEIHMMTAFLWSQRATCKRPNRNIGCIITNSEMNAILAVSYNGPPTAMTNDSCRNIKGDCGCVHAEENAIARVDSTILHKILFCTMIPCEGCANLIAQSNIDLVYYCQDYRNTKGLDRLRACHLDVIQVDTPTIDFDF